MKPFDDHGRFQAVADGGAQLRRLAVQGAGVTIFSQGVMLAVQIITTVVLARLLMPSDFGVVAMVERGNGGGEVSGFAGLSRRAPLGWTSSTCSRRPRRLSGAGESPAPQPGFSITSRLRELRARALGLKPTWRIACASCVR